MKKKTPLILFLFCAIVIAGCSKKNDPPLPEAPTSNPPGPINPTINNPSGITAFIGDTISIAGTNLGTTAAVLSAKFGAVQANVISASGTAVKVVVPDDMEEAAVKIHLYAGTNEILPASDFKLKAPVIQSISATSGPVGQSVVIKGQGFTSHQTNQITFGGKAISATAASHTSLSLQVPAGTPAGNYPIAVTVAGLTVTTATPFTVTTTKTPTFTGFAPQTAFVGDTITLTGTDMGTDANALKVKFGNIDAEVISASGTSAKVVVPGDIEQASVKISIATTGSSQVVSNTNFQLKAPVISAISVTSGFIGDQFQITGKGFSNSFTNQVNFGSTAIKTSSASNSFIRLFIPRGLAAGKYSISVTVAGLKTTGTYTFEVLTPTITSFTPNTGKKDDIMTLTGTNLREVNGITDISAPRVFFDETTTGSSIQEVLHYVKKGSNQIQLRIPQLKTGSTYKIRVMVKTGVAVTSTDIFTYKE